MEIASVSRGDCVWQPSFLPSVCFGLVFLANAALVSVFFLGMAAGACLLHIWRSPQKSVVKFPPHRHNPESGNVFFALFAALGMVGVVGAGMMTVMKGPVTTMSHVTKRSIAENNMIASTRLAVVSSTIQQPDSGDCDADGFVEPLPFRDAGAAPKPAGGGYLPTTLGASLMDPWGTEYGYCVWDHGSVVKAEGCGGAGAYRLAGAPNDSQYAVAVISAGQDRTFQTSCNAYDANADNRPDVPLLNKPAGSDDVILGYTYAEANALGGLWALKSGEPETATIKKGIEVEGGGSFGGSLILGGGLLLPDQNSSGACAEVNDSNYAATHPPRRPASKSATGRRVGRLDHDQQRWWRWGQRVRRW